MPMIAFPNQSIQKTHPSGIYAHLKALEHNYRYFQRPNRSGITPANQPNLTIYLAGHLK